MNAAFHHHKAYSGGRGELQGVCYKYTLRRLPPHSVLLRQHEPISGQPPCVHLGGVFRRAAEEEEGPPFAGGHVGDSVLQGIV